MNGWRISSSNVTDHYHVPIYGGLDSLMEDFQRIYKIISKDMWDYKTHKSSAYFSPHFPLFFSKRITNALTFRGVNEMSCKSSFLLMNSLSMDWKVFTVSCRFQRLENLNDWSVDYFISKKRSQPKVAWL